MGFKKWEEFFPFVFFVLNRCHMCIGHAHHAITPSSRGCVPVGSRIYIYIIVKFDMVFITICQKILVVMNTSNKYFDTVDHVKI